MYLHVECLMNLLPSDEPFSPETQQHKALAGISSAPPSSF